MNPGLHARHLINLFPIISILGIVCVASFNRFLKYRSFEDYLKDSFFRQAFILLFLVGLVFLGYQSFRHHQRVSPRSQLYPLIGEWLQKNTTIDSVIMSDPTPSIHYYARRPVIMFPRPATPDELEEILEKYQVQYLVVFYQDQLKSLPDEGLTTVAKFSSFFQGKEQIGLILKRTGDLNG